MLRTHKVHHDQQHDRDSRKEIRAGLYQPVWCALVVGGAAAAQGRLESDDAVEREPGENTMRDLMLQGTEKIHLDAAHEQQPNREIQRGACNKGHEKMHAADDPEQFLPEGDRSRGKIRRAENRERPFDYAQDAGNFLVKHGQSVYRFHKGRSMAQSSTIYVFTVRLADADRGVYETLNLRVAQHPSESPDYLLTRVL